ncbi:hypothetical protein [Paraburkholderia sp. BL10I2N1]|uniref:hypothetical protein n=1 Tax=Paraburkholderia sp. BL10I2N1 TaxID=1938796 RepID=UPI001414FE81|nr:hypothetical protein [Paraburkholderia sp. BL10I2N1]
MDIDRFDTPQRMNAASSRSSSVAALRSMTSLAAGDCRKMTSRWTSACAARSMI